MSPPGDGYDADVPTIRDAGTSITNAADPLGNVAGGEPEAPNAGTATGDVIDYLQSLSEAMRDFTQAVEGTGNAVTQAVDTYVRDDHGAAGDVRTVQFPAGAP